MQNGGQGPPVLAGPDRLVFHSYRGRYISLFKGIMEEHKLKHLTNDFLTVKSAVNKGLSEQRYS